MLGKMHFLAVALCVSSYAMAVPHSIGNVTARGETRIDNYPVKGSGTVFDGSVLETGQTASSRADVRLEGDSVITLAIDSQGTVFRDHFVLQRGKVEFGSSSTFRVETGSLVMTTSSPQTNGSVSIASGDTVTVVALAGDIEVRASDGALIAKVHAGHPLEFSSNGKPSSDVSESGVLTSENGHYFLKGADTDLKYEVKGTNNLQDLAGSEVTAAGTLAACDATTDADAMILAASVARFDPSAPSSQTAALISGLSVGRFTPDAVTGRTCLYGKCCPGRTKPVLCCPNQPSLGYCCPDDTFSYSRCHHSR